MTPPVGRLFHYECSAGHRQSSPHPLEKCQVMVKGRPCAGVLGGVRRTSRKEK